MKTHKENITHDIISAQRAAAEVGDPRSVKECSKKEADHKVTLISRPYADNRRKQCTFYFKEIS